MEISTMLLKRRKTFTSIIILVIALMTLVNISVSALTQTVLQYKWERAVTAYGNFSFGISQISEDMEIIVKEQLGENNVGCYEIYSSVDFLETTLTLGYVDDVFRKMAGVDLLEGRFPENDHEVVVESFVLNMLGHDDTIEFEHNGKIITLEIVGVIDNYSARLSLPDDMQLGENTYPNIICAKENESSSQSMLVNLGSKVSVRKSYIENTKRIDNEIFKMGFPSEDVFYNNNLLNKGLVGCHEIWMYSLFFYFVVVGVLSISLYMLLRVFYKDYRKKLAVLEVCGMKSNDTLRILKQQLIFLYVSGSCIGLMISIVVIFLMKDDWNVVQNTALWNMVFFTIFGEVVLAAVMLLVVFQYKAESVQYSIADNLRNEHIAFGYRIHGKNIVEGFEKPNVKITALLVAVFLVSYFSLYIYNIAIYDNPDMPDYQLFSKEVVTSEVVNGFTVESNPASCILASDVEELEDLQDSIVYDLWPDFNNYTILLDKADETEYFKSWNSAYESMDTSYEDSIIAKNWPEEMKGVIPIQNVDFVVANDTLLAEIIQQYNLDVTKAELEENKGIVLFLPQYFDAEVGIEVGNQIKIGGISQYGDEVIGEQTFFNIGAVVKEIYSLKHENMVQERNGIIILLSEKTAKESDIFRGYRSISLYIKDGISEEVEKKIDDLMYEMTSKIQGGVLYSKKLNLEDEKIFSSYNKTLAGMLLGINLLFGTIVAIIFAYQIIMKNKYKYGILRVLGLSSGKNFQYLCIGIMKSFLLALLCATAITFFFIGDIEGYRYYFGYYLRSMIETLILCVIACMVMYRMLSKMTISNVLDDN